MLRKVSFGLVLVAGVFWLVSTLVLGYPSKTQAVDHLTSSLRPAFTNASLAQDHSDITTVNQFVKQFETRAVPALSKDLHVTPTQLVTQLGTKYPKVGRGIAQLPTSLPYFDHLVAGLQAQQKNFDQAAAIPTKSLPATTVNWLFVALGVIGIAIGLGGLVFGRRAGGVLLGLAAAVGVVVIAVSLIISVPAKTQAVDNLTNAFRPVFTAQGAAETRTYLDNFQGLYQQLSTEALPGLATALKVTPAQLDASLGQQFPAVAAGLKAMPGILSRFDVLVTKIQQNLGNFHQADSIPTATTPATLLQAQLVVPAGVLALAGGAGLAVPLVAARGRSRRSVAPGAGQDRMRPAM